MEGMNIFEDDKQFQGIFNDIDRHRMAVREKLKVRGVAAGSDEWNKSFDGIDDAVRNYRSKSLKDEAIAAGKPKEYADYRASAYLAGENVMGFSQWQSNKRNAVSAFASDMMGRMYLGVEGAVGGVVGGTVLAVANKGIIGDETIADQWDLDRAKSIAEVRKQVLDQRNIQYEKMQRDLNTYGTSVYKSREEIDAAYPLPEMPDDLKQRVDRYGIAMRKNVGLADEITNQATELFRAVNKASVTSNAFVSQLANPSDPRDTRLLSDVLQDQSKAGRFIGDAIGTTAVSLPAMFNPWALSAFAPMGYKGGVDRLMENWKKKAHEAKTRGLPIPDPPSADQLQSAGVAGAVSETASEGIGNALELAVLLNKTWKLESVVTMAERQAAKDGADTTASIFKNILEGAADKQGTKGIAVPIKSAVRTLSAAKKVVPRLAAASGIEALEEVGNEVAMSAIVDPMTGSFEWNTMWDNMVESGLVAAASVGGTGSIVLAADTLKRRAMERQIAAQLEATLGKGWEDAVKSGKAEQMVFAAIESAANRKGMDRLIAMSAPASGEAMALNQVRQFNDGGRMAVAINEANSKATMSAAVRETMKAAGIDVDNPIKRDGVAYYTNPALAQATVDALNSSDPRTAILQISGRKSYIDQGDVPAGAVVVENPAGQIVEIVPMGMMTNIDSALSAISADAAKDGNKARFLDESDGAALADRISLQVDADREASGLRPIKERAPRKLDVERASANLRIAIGAFVSKELDSSDARKSIGLPDDATDVDVRVELKPVASNRLSDGERRMTSAGLPVTVLEGKVVVGARGADGKAISITRDIPMQGLFDHQVLPEGLMLIRDQNGTAFNYRSAWMIAVHEAMHRNLANSRGGAKFLSMLFAMNPEETLKQGTRAYRMYKGEFSKMTDAEILNDMIARYEAAKDVLSSKTATGTERAAARRELSQVEHFAEETITNRVEQTGGTAMALASEYESTYRNAEGMSLVKFVAWLSNVMARNGLYGREAQAIIDMMKQRSNGVRIANLKLDQKFREAAKQRYMKAFAVAGQSAQPATAAGAVEATPSASMRRENAAPQEVAIPKVAAPPDETVEAKTASEPSSGIVGEIAGMAARAVPFLAQASAQITPMGTTSRLASERLARERQAQQQPQPSDEIVAPRLADDVQVEETDVSQVSEEKLSSIPPVDREAYLNEVARRAVQREAESVPPDGSMQAAMRKAPRLPVSQGQRDFYDNSFFYDKKTETLQSFYHGTAVEQPIKVMRTSTTGTFGKGIYLTIDEGEGQYYARGKKRLADEVLGMPKAKPVLEHLFIRAMKPFLVNLDDRRPIVDALYRAGLQNDARLMELAREYSLKPAGTDADKRVKEEFANLLQRRKDDRGEKLTKYGYDSMLVMNAGVQFDVDEVMAGVPRARLQEGEKIIHVIAWQSNQVKRVTNLNPTLKPALEASMRPIPIADMTPAQRRWFKGSKVVDDTGSAKPVVHATLDDFVQFDVGQRGKVTGARSAQKAFWFTDNPEVAATYAEYRASTITVADRGPLGQANIDKAQERLVRAEQSDVFSEFDEDRGGWVPYVRSFDEYGSENTQQVGGVRGPVYPTQVDADNAAYDQRIADISAAEMNLDETMGRAKAFEDEAMSGARLIPALLQIKNPLVHDFAGGDYSTQSFNDLVDQAIADGNDGVIFKNVRDSATAATDAPSTVYGVFKPNQIKGRFNAKPTAEANYMASLRDKGNLSPEVMQAIEARFTQPQAIPTESAMAEQPDMPSETSIAQGIVISERQRYSRSPFRSKIVDVRNELARAIITGTSIEGLPAKRDHALKDWMNWLTKRGIPKAQLRFSMPWMFQNKWGLQVGRNVWDRAEMARKRSEWYQREDEKEQQQEKYNATKPEAERKPYQRKPFPMPFGETERLTPVQFLAELDSAVPWTFVQKTQSPMFEHIRGVMQRQNGMNYTIVGMVLTPMEPLPVDATDSSIDAIHRIATTMDPDPVVDQQVLAELASLTSGQPAVLHAKALRDVVKETALGTTWAEPHFSVQALTIHYRHTTPRNPMQQGDLFVDEIQSVYRARASEYAQGEKATRTGILFDMPQIADPNFVLETSSGVVALTPDMKWNITGRMLQFPWARMTAYNNAEIRNLLQNARQSDDLSQTPIWETTDEERNTIRSITNSLESMGANVSPEHFSQNRGQAVTDVLADTFRRFGTEYQERMVSLLEQSPALMRAMAIQLVRHETASRLPLVRRYDEQEMEQVEQRFRRDLRDAMDSGKHESFFLQNGIETEVESRHLDSWIMLAVGAGDASLTAVEPTDPSLSDDEAKKQFLQDTAEKLRRYQLRFSSLISGDNLPQNISSLRLIKALRSGTTDRDGVCAIMHLVYQAAIGSDVFPTTDEEVRALSLGRFSRSDLEELSNDLKTISRWLHGETSGSSMGLSESEKSPIMRMLRHLGGTHTQGLFPTQVAIDVFKKSGYNCFVRSAEGSYFRIGFNEEASPSGTFALADPRWQDVEVTNGGYTVVAKPREGDADTIFEFIGNKYGFTRRVSRLVGRSIVEEAEPRASLAQLNDQLYALKVFEAIRRELEWDSEAKSIMLSPSEGFTPQAQNFIDEMIHAARRIATAAVAENAPYVQAQRESLASSDQISKPMVSSTAFLLNGIGIGAQVDMGATWMKQVGVPNNNQTVTFSDGSRITISYPSRVVSVNAMLVPDAPADGDYEANAARHLSEPNERPALDFDSARVELLDASADFGNACFDFYGNARTAISWMNRLAQSGEQLRDDVAKAKQVARGRAEAGMPRAEVAEARVPQNRSGGFYTIVNYAGFNPTFYHRLADLYGPASYNDSREDENRPLKPLPMTHELKDAKGAIDTQDWYHVAFAGIVRDAIAKGARAGSRIVFALPNDTATNSMMPPVAATAAYGWNQESYVDTACNLIRGANAEYIAENGSVFGNGPVPNPTRIVGLGLRADIPKRVTGAWLLKPKPTQDQVDYREQTAPLNINSIFLAKLENMLGVDSLRSVSNQRLREVLLPAWRQALDEERTKFNENAARTYGENWQEKYDAELIFGQTDKLYDTAASVIEKTMQAEQSGTPLQEMKGNIRGGLEKWSAMHGGSVVYENYRNSTDSLPRMQLVLDEKLVETARNGFPMASMRRGVNGAIDVAKTMFVDKYHELARYTDELRKANGGRLSDSANPYMGARVLSGRISARQDELEETYKNLLHQMATAGITIQSMDEFLTAQHAKERNEHIASINDQMPDGGSGMTTQDASDILLTHRANGTFKRHERIANKWRQLMSEALDSRVKSGLIRQDEADMLRDKWPNYVPLRGKPAEPFDDDFDDMGSAFGRGLSTAGRGMPQALGRESQAEAVTSQIGFVAEDTLRRVERNNVGNRFLRLVVGLNDPRMAEVIRPVTRAKVRGKVRLVYDGQWSADPRNFGLYLDKPMTINGFDYEAGDLVVIRMNNATLARGVNKSLDISILRRVLEVPNSAFRLLTTGVLHPPFAVLNTIRDAGMGTLANYADRGVLDTMRMASRWPSSFYNVLRDETKGLGPKGDYLRYVMAGGAMMGLGPNDLEQKARQFDSLYAQVQNKDPRSTALRDYLLNWYPAVFKAGETATRLAHFKQVTDKTQIANHRPLSDEEGALSSRDLTVDFGKGGEFKPIFNTLYVYSNAAIQGTDATLRALGKQKRLAAYLIGAGFLTSMMARMMAGDDDELKMNRWDMVQDYEKSSLIHFYSPNGSGNAVRLPQPYGFNVLFAFGSDLADMVFGPKTAGTVASNLMDNTMNFLNPLGGSGITKGMENMVNFAFPTLLRFIPELAQNRDFAGNPIYPEQKFGPETAQAYQAFANTPELYKWAAETVNESTGGNEIDSGYVDFHPDSLEYMIGFLFSGLGRDAMSIEAVATGEKPPSQLPLIRNLYVGPDVADRFAVSEYYRLRDQYASELVRAREMQKGIAGRNLGNLDATRLQVATDFSNTDKLLKDIRANLKSATDKPTIEMLRAQRLRLMKQAISRANSLTNPKKPL